MTYLPSAMAAAPASAPGRARPGRRSRLLYAVRMFYLLVHAQRIVGIDFLLDVLEGFLGVSPSWSDRSSGFPPAKALCPRPVLERLDDGFLGIAHMCLTSCMEQRAMYCGPSSRRASPPPDRIADTLGSRPDWQVVAPGADQRRRGHLAAGHAVDAVVYEYRGDILTAGGGVGYLGRADRRQVAVALISEHDASGRTRFMPVAIAGARPCAASCHVAVEVVVREHAAARPAPCRSSYLRC